MLILILATNVYVVWRMYQILPNPWLKTALSPILVIYLYSLLASRHLGSEIPSRLPFRISGGDFVF